MKRWKKIGIIAGGGDLPGRLAQACQEKGWPFYVIRLTGFADDALDAFEGINCDIAKIGQIIRHLKHACCDAVVMVGRVARPDFSKLRPDWRGAALIPKAVVAARHGDGAILDVLVETFEAAGFLMVGAEEVLDTLFVGVGPVGRIMPGATDFSDMRKAAEIVRVLGPFDIGQGAVVRNGFVLAIEAAEGTDVMLERCATLSPELKGYEPGEKTRGPCGILLKQPKPGQELRVDLPTIGIKTIEKVYAAGLRGVAVEAKAALIVDSGQVAVLADKLGVFVYGFKKEEVIP